MARGAILLIPRQKSCAWAIDCPCGMTGAWNFGIPRFPISIFLRVMIVRPCMSYWNGLTTVVWSKRTIAGLNDHCGETNWSLYMVSPHRGIHSGVTLPRKLLLMLCLDLLKMLLRR